MNFGVLCVTRIQHCANWRTEMASENDNTKLTLERKIGERRTHHRALLLYGMQNSRKRSVRAVARALGISEGTARNWRKKSEWDARIAAQPEPHDLMCLQVYRREYMADFGQHELSHVARNITQPISSTDLQDSAARAQHEATVAAHNAVGDSMQAVEQATVQAIKEHRRDVREDADRHVKLVDASLGVIARKLKADEVRVSVRDIPVLLECRDRLVNVINGTHASGGALAVESVRVKQARENGGDLLEAMLTDAEELVVILEALHAGSSADTRHDDHDTRFEQSVKAV